MALLTLLFINAMLVMIVLGLMRKPGTLVVALKDMLKRPAETGYRPPR